MCLVLARCLSAVVAADAITEDVYVVEVGRHPADSCMAVVASVVARNMSRVFACGAGTVVTANTVSHDAAVIKHRWQPGSGAVAIVTLIAGGNVVERLACRLDAIMTARTAACYRGVVHESDNRPVRRHMTVGTFTRGLDVVRWFRRRAHETAVRVAA